MTARKNRPSARAKHCEVFEGVLELVNRGHSSCGVSTVNFWSSTPHKYVVATCAPHKYNHNGLVTESIVAFENLSKIEWARWIYRGEMGKWV